MLLFVASAWADPLGDPTALLVAQQVREAGVPALLGASDRGPLRLAQLALAAGLDPDDPASAAWARSLAPELAWVGSPTELEIRAGWHPTARLVVGDLAPDLARGDVESGLLSARAGAAGRLYYGPLLASLEPEIDLDLFSPALALVAREAWVGAELHGVQLAFGQRDRWLGPGRHGSLVLTDNARPAPLGSLAIEESLPRLGRVRFEAGAGWLDGARDDVERPGWLIMDLRWAPMPWLELGASRMGVFGGVGRPAPRLGQLLLPTEPHVSDDPDQSEPDQNELASLDLRVLVPLARWLPNHRPPLRTLELWWQYGGEDVIGKEWNGVPYPSLAGVANLGGGELAVGPVLLTIEGARLLDDTFRWYTGHRVYHEGFTQDGRIMGHPAGGDARSLWGGLTWLPDLWGGRIGLERRVRVGVVDDADGQILALSTDELHHRLQAELWRASSWGWWRLGAEGARIQGREFVPGDDVWEARIYVAH